MTSLLDNILNWALLEKNHFEPKPEGLNLNEIITEVTRLYSDVAESKKIKFEIEDVNGLEVYADRNGVSTILRNLFDNAIKYAPAKSMIKLKAVPSEDMIAVYVENLGRIIREEFVQNVLRNNDPITNKSVGLGLLICKELTELNKGAFSIFCENDERVIANLSLPSYSRALTN